ARRARRRLRRRRPREGRRSGRALRADDGERVRRPDVRARGRVLRPACRRALARRAPDPRRRRLGPREERGAGGLRTADRRRRRVRHGGPRLGRDARLRHAGRERLPCVDRADARRPLRARAGRAPQPDPGADARGTPAAPRQRPGGSRRQPAQADRGPPRAVAAGRLERARLRDRPLGARVSNLWGAPLGDAVAAGKVQAFEKSLPLYELTGQEEVAPYVTVNVNLWPQTIALIANPRRLGGRAAGWLREAAHDAVTRSLALADRDTVA